MRSEFTVEITKFALNLIGQAVNFDHVLGQELLKEEKKCDGDWSCPPVLPTALFFFFFLFARGRGWREREKTSLINNSLTLTCSFFRAKEIGGFSLELVDTFSPCDYTRSHQHLPRGFRAHGSAIYKHHPGIPETLM